MRMVLLYVALLCLLGGCAAITPATLEDVSNRIGEVKAELDANIETIRAHREETGRGQGGGLNLEEWLLIGFGIVGSALGVNQIRDRKYVRAARAS